MTSRILTVTFDCHDPHLLGRFWAGALGYVEHPDEPNEPGDPEVLLVDPRGLHPELLFLAVPEGKTAKNRLHLDLRPDVRRDDEVERILALGATMVDDRRQPDGTGWAVLADPEGNELCIVRSAAERDDIATPEPTEPVRRTAAERTLGDREALASMLDRQRAQVLAKVATASQFVATRCPGPSATSIAGVVKHLALVEDSWFAEDLAALPSASWYAAADFDADPDWEFHTALDEPLALQVARYEEACARARELAAAVEDLDAPVGPGGEDRSHDRNRPPFTLRWLYLHMIEETARHLGHIDLLREYLDGTTGE